MNLIFDLDGTLIDSAPGILSTLMHVASEHKINCADKLNPELVGPPLRDILNELTGWQQEQIIIDAMVRTFILHYDKKGVLETKVYCGIPEILKTLKEKKHTLYIATNKRMAPTQVLMEYFSWNKYFDGVYSLDFFKPPLKNKASILHNIIDIHGLYLPDTIYIGDRLEDYDSANQVGMNFLCASWGYSNQNFNLSKGVLVAPSDIYNYVN
jgi:phosphoglycolate phosphatase